ncbi:VirK protein [Legionella sp. MW5194]|uniref:VirK family protein n=1 Tax=Legionella sp. MW5194 TaxID=2662448 RepID=UPI00193C9E83|nr:VirK family protein [Legionella sp. MW5194]QRN04429.1 VirK protein [Legionella sp. MW5194]
MKTATGLAAALLAFSAEASDLSSFAEVAEAVKQGKALSFVTALNACESDIPSADVTTAITPNAVMLVNGSKVTASDRHFTINDPSLPGEAVFGYSKFEIHASGAATVKITLLRAADYSKIREFQMRCELGKGFKVFAK